MNASPMNQSSKIGRSTTEELRQQFRKQETPHVCLTAYTTSMARLLATHVDILLVGDSLGMVVYGFPDTLSVTMDMMAAHGAAVRRGAPSSCIVVDMPYGSYEESREQALKNALRLCHETGCNAVKLEGGRTMAPVIRWLVDHGVPVMAHIGLMPQSIKKMGGYKIQGLTNEQITSLKDDVKAVEEAGAFSVVIEGTNEVVAHELTKMVSIATIGIGASPSCDGQVLVIDDVLGMTVKPPRFSKAFADVPSLITEAAATYAADVRSRRFPTQDHCFHIK